MTGLPRTRNRRAIVPGDPCGKCGRGMRPSGSDRGAHGGMPEHAAKGLCRTCYNGSRACPVPARSKTAMAVDPDAPRVPKGWFAKAKPQVPRKRQLSAETAGQRIERVGPTDPGVLAAARRSVLARGGDDTAMLLAMLGLDES